MGYVRPLLIAALVIAEVGMWQWRMVITVRGNRAAAMALGVVGAVLQITAISQVVTNLDDPLSIAAYAGGVGIGVALGLFAGDRLTPGALKMTIVTAEVGVADALWQRGWPATVHAGHGESGPVHIVSVAINRRHESLLRAHITHLAPTAAWTTQEIYGRAHPLTVGL